MGRSGKGGPPVSEHEVEAGMRRLMQSWDGLALVGFSPLNLDRMVSVFKAAKSSGRCLLVDPYAALILRGLAD